MTKPGPSGTKKERLSIEPTNKHPGRIGQMFNRIASTYDLLNHLLSLGIDLKWRRETAKRLDSRPRERVLDLACGTGDLSLAVLNKSPGCRIVGVDLALNMLSIAREKAIKRGYHHSTIQFLCGDILQLPFKENAFDRAMIAFGIRNVMDTSRAFKEIHRVLKPGARIGILEFSLPKRTLLKRLYLFYFRKVLPFIGGAVSGEPEAYRYLPSSVNSFTPPEMLSLEMEEIGYRILRIEYFTTGISYLILGEKSNPGS